eukprot:evm.model.scf_1375.5 EVM.evm.TU.scf_1375.5   scf_1375:26494-30018(-)
MGGVASSPGRDGGCALRHGSAEDVGGRRTMEDAHAAAGGEASGCPARCRGFYVVCDGHGGADAANFVKAELAGCLMDEEDLAVDFKKALGSAFQRVDAAFARAVDAGRACPSGTTALAAAVIGSSIVVANAGDCRAVLCRAGRAQVLTNDHRPSCPSERERVLAAGGTITSDGYLNGDLSVSRAIGDFHLPGMKDGSAGPLICRPEIVEVGIDDDCEFLVLASDGVFDAMTAHTVVAVARRELGRSNDPGRASQEVVDRALAADVLDNVTVLTVCLRSEPPPPRLLRIPGSGSKMTSVEKPAASVGSLIKVSVGSVALA